MIVVDTSALIAIIRSEPESNHFAVILAGSRQAAIAAPTLFETQQVAYGKVGESGPDEVQGLILGFGIEIVDWTAEHAELATQAFVRFGKGQKRPGKLNFGDCMSYALAKSLNAPLLYKGDDFAQTDIVAAA